MQVAVNFGGIIPENDIKHGNLVAPISFSSIFLLSTPTRTATKVYIFDIAIQADFSTQAAFLANQKSFYPLFKIYSTQMTASLSHTLSLICSVS